MKNFFVAVSFAFILAAPALAPSVQAQALTGSCTAQPGNVQGHYEGTACVPDAAPASQSSSQSGFKALAPIPGLTGSDTINGSAVESKDLANFFNNLYKYLIGIAAILAVIQIIRGGLEISTQDSIPAHSKGREHIQQAILGLVLVLSPVLVFTIINPSILNLSINLDPLDTAPSTTGGGNNDTPPVLSQFECTTLRSGTYLETARCPAKPLANAYVCKNTSLTLRQNFVDLPCRSVDPITKECMEQIFVECIVQPPLKLIYYYTEDIGYIYNSQNTPAKVLPRDTSKESAFITGCAADGGQFQKLRKETVTCPSDGGIPPYDPLKVSGVVCQMFELNCRAKDL